MRLTRFRVDGDAKIGDAQGDRIVELSEGEGSFSEVLRTYMDGGELTTGDTSYSVDEVTYLPPTTAENTVFASSLNYRSHIDETATGVPEIPWMFTKLYRSLIGHVEPIPKYASLTEVLDYEAELAVVIGTPAWNVSPDDALEHVAGYTILNDTTARDIMYITVGDTERVDWFSAKALQKSTPVGPSVVTADEISDPGDLQIVSRLNGETMQDESSKLMIRDPAELISFLSTRVELQPGDVVATGTPEGVGSFQDISLTEGDTVEIEIEEVGTLTNTVTDRP